jgi:hypothetical protein
VVAQGCGDAGSAGGDDGQVLGVLRLALTIPQTASLAIGAALITVVDYCVLLVVIAVAAASCSDRPKATACVPPPQHSRPAVNRRR